MTTRYLKEKPANDDDVRIFGTTIVIEVYGIVNQKPDNTLVTKIY
jgi:hypothetical protein